MYLIERKFEVQSNDKDILFNIELVFNEVYWKRLEGLLFNRVSEMDRQARFGIRD